MATVRVSMRVTTISVSGITIRLTGGAPPKELTASVLCTQGRTGGR